MWVRGLKWWRVAIADVVFRTRNCCLHWHLGLSGDKLSSSGGALGSLVVLRRGVSSLESALSDGKSRNQNLHPNPFIHSTLDDEAHFPHHYPEFSNSASERACVQL